MNYIMPITQKGQVTIPKKIRDLLGLKKNSRVEFDVTKNQVKIKKVETILDFAGKFKAPKGMTALKAREYMETHYERV